MPRAAFVLKIQRELCQPKSFGTFEKRAFSKDPVTTGPANLTGQLPGLVYVPEVVFLEAHDNLSLNNGSVKISWLWKSKCSWIGRKDSELRQSEDSYLSKMGKWYHGYGDKAKFLVQIEWLNCKPFTGTFRDRSSVEIKRSSTSFSSTTVLRFFF